jgi:hypothetical protein
VAGLFNTMAGAGFAVCVAKPFAGVVFYHT